MAGTPVDLRAAAGRAAIVSHLDAMQTASAGQVAQTSAAAAYASEAWALVQTDGSQASVHLNGRGLDCATHPAAGADDATVACDGIAITSPNAGDHFAVWEVTDAGTHNVGDTFLVTALQDAVSLDSEYLSVVGQAHDVALSIAQNKFALAVNAPSCSLTDSTNDLRRALAVGTYVDINGTALVGYNPTFSSTNTSILTVAIAGRTTILQPGGTISAALDVVCGGSAPGTASAQLTTVSGEILGVVGAVVRSQPINVSTPFVVTTAADSGSGSLRQAILNANGSAAPAMISFAIGVGGQQTIALVAGLPSTAFPVIIDGTTQPGFAGKPLIEIQKGLGISGGHSTVRGLIINGAPLVLNTNGSNTIVGNFIGTDKTGSTSGGIACCPPAPAFEIASDSPANIIGGTTAADRNIISGALDDLQIDAFSNNNVIEGNYIGLDVTGTFGVFTGGGGGAALFIGSNGNTVGGAAPGAGNVISASATTTGIEIQGSGNTVQGNFIGTNAAGNAAVPNAVGVHTSGNNLVGGAAPGTRNVIWGNSIGVDASGGTVEGNFIGTGADGVSTVGNALDGVAMEGGTIVTANVIAHNGRYGVGVWNGSANQVLANAIFSNAGGGIVLEPGTNSGQSPPSLTSASSDGGSTLIQGGLSGSPNAAYHAEFFSDLSCDPTGAGEGRIPLGSLVVTTNGSGNALFVVTVPVAVSPGQIVSATASDSSGDTSQFSVCVTTTSNNYCGIRRADINGDAAVNVQDLTLFAKEFALTVPPGAARGDQNGDGVVNVQDLTLFAKSFAHFTNECP